MGAKQLNSTSTSGNGHADLSKRIDKSSLNEYTLEDLKSCTVKRAQFGTNPLVGSLVIGNRDNPVIIGLYGGIGGALADLFGVGKNNCVHCFCFLEIEELVNDDEGIIIEFGEYEYGDPNDFKVKTFYTSKKGGLRLYVVKTKWFENYCSLARVKCKINKKEILDDILVGISRNYKWRLEFYDRNKQNCHDFVAVLLNYLEIQNFEICKGTLNIIPDKIKKVLSKK